MKTALIIMVLWIFDENLLKYRRVRKNTKKKCTGFNILMRYDVQYIILKLYQIKLIKSYNCSDQKYFKGISLK